MPIIATGQVSIVDLSDGKSLSCYITANLPKTQIYDPNPGGTVTPDWSGTPKLILTPVVFSDQVSLPLNSPGLVIAWKRKEGAGAETGLSNGEAASGGILTVSRNALNDVPSKLLSYCVYVTYTDPGMGVPVNIMADITFSQLQTALHAKSVWISGEQIFKYDQGGGVSPAQIVLTANLQNLVVSKWQYKGSDGNWQDYPTTADNASITGTTLVIKPTHNVFADDCAAIRVLTSNPNMNDVMTVYKARDGVDGSAGASAPIVFLTNENITFPANASGQASATTFDCNVVAYLGAAKVTPVVGAITGKPSGMNVIQRAAVDNEIPLSIFVEQNSTLGGAGVQAGMLGVPVTSPVTTTLQIRWSKVNTGAAGQNAVVFSLYAPDGTVFVNGDGKLTVKAAAYDGTTEITSGATYVWKKFVSGNWQVVTGQTGNMLTVNGSDVAGVASFQCTMTYGGKQYTDTISLLDKSDNYQAVIESSGGDIFKNGIGESILTCRLFQNGVEVDGLKTYHISETAPPSPVAGTFWYKVNKTAKTVVLQKYSGSAWANASGSDLHEKTYKWYRLDKDGNALDTSAPFKSGKVVFINSGDVEIKTTFKAEVE